MAVNRTRQHNTCSVAIDGQTVRRMRKMQGETLVSFAPKAKLSPQYVSQIERGLRPTVSPPAFARLCDALGIDPANRGSMVREDVA